MASGFDILFLYMYVKRMTKKRKIKHEMLVSFSPDDYKMLVKQAEKEATTKVDIIRRAIREYVKEKGKNDV